MVHPLTDRKLFIEFLTLGRDYYPDNRNGFSYDDMRAVADWQLRQVIEFIAKEDTVYYDTPTLLADYIKQAMRPTQEENG